MASFITAPRGLAGLTLPLPGGAGRMLALWAERRETRRALARLDTHLLADIGLTPEEAAAECARPFWKG